MAKRLENDCEMLNLDARLKSFKNWPFDADCSCTPETMAEAGFYFCGGDNEPDLVRCYFCRKELVNIVVSLLTSWLALSPEGRLGAQWRPLEGAWEPRQRDLRLHQSGQEAQWVDCPRYFGNTGAGEKQETVEDGQGHPGRGSQSKSEEIQIENKQIGEKEVK